MPRLSLYRPERTNDFKFFDKTISEKYTVGGLDIFVHKYLGIKRPAIAATAIKVGNDYQIAVPGTTDFTAIGAADNNADTIFTATGVGTGDGTVYDQTGSGDATQPIYDSQDPLFVEDILFKENRTFCFS